MEENNIKLELHYLSFHFYAMKRMQKVVRTHCPVANRAAEFPLRGRNIEVFHSSLVSNTTVFQLPTS